MDCPDAKLRTRFESGELPQAEQGEVAAHLRSCPQCQSRDQLATLSVEPPTREPLSSRPTLPQRPVRVRALEPGTKVGRYIILSLKGQGGMGEVYQAHDPELNRRVALKWVRGERVSAELGTARLLREAQAMARLSHPNIVAVHDVGTHGDDLFLAMEYVEGESLRSWLREPRSWRAVRDVFLAAGRGLLAAHAAGLLHRDFKPDNVLLGADRRVRVGDFGLARLASAPDEPQGSVDTPSSPSLDTPLTEANAILGTPAYMAPEVLDGQAASPLSDQFSFGVSLYEALYGQRPFPAKELSALRAQQRQKLPAPPRQQVPARLERLLERALAEDPKARFESLEALLEALGDDPALRLRRGGGVLLLAGAAAVAGYAVWSSANAQRKSCEARAQELRATWKPEQRARARAAFARTRSEGAPPPFEKLEAAADELSRRWETTHRTTCLKSRVEGEVPEELLAAQTLCIEGQRRELRALAELWATADEKVVARASAMLRALPNPSECEGAAPALAARLAPPEPAAAAGVDRVREELARAKALFAGGRLKDSLPAAEGALELAKKTGYRPALAEAHEMLAQVYSQQRDAKRAEAQSLEAITHAEATRHDRVAARSWLRLAFDTLTLASRQDEAERYARIAAAALDRLGDEPTLRSELESLLGNLARSRNQPDAAVTHFREAIALRERALGPEHEGLQSALHNLGLTLVDAGKAKEALSYLERSLKLKERTTGGEHVDLAPTLVVMGNAYADLGDDARALELFERGLRVIERHHGKNHRMVALVALYLAGVHIALGNFRDAEALAARSAALREHEPPSHLAAALVVQAGALEEQGEAKKARALAERALALVDQKTGDQAELACGIALVKLAELDLGEGKMAQAARHLDRGLDLQEKFGSSARDLAVPRSLYARALLAEGRLGEAQAQVKLLRPLIESLNPADRGIARFGAAQVEHASGHADKALADARAAWQELRVHPHRARRVQDELSAWAKARFPGAVLAGPETAVPLDGGT